MKDYNEKHTEYFLVIFEGNVYDVLSYLPLHPGGSDMIEPLKA